MCVMEMDPEERARPGFFLFDLVMLLGSKDLMMLLGLVEAL